MGRRSRQRASSAGGAPATSTPDAAKAPEPPRTPRRRATVAERPEAPWHPFPLVELSILAGLVLMVAGFVVGDDGGGILVVGGLALVGIASLENTLREHLTGYRSHSGVLAGAVAVALMAGLGVAGVNRFVVAGIGIIVGALVFFALRSTFQRKAGGLTWRA
jgi:hypothetical protein